MADKTEYKVQLVQTEEIPAPDDLLAGFDHKTDTITLSVAGQFKRGMLLMSGSDGFASATAEGVASSEVCILCENVEVPEESFVSSYGYFRGTFNARSVILPYETEDDNHDELIEAIRVPLRKQGIFLV